MVDGGVNTEGQEVNAKSEVEQRKVELETYLEDAKVGTPKFMSFWDQLDLSYAEADLLETDVLGSNDENRTRALIREEFVKNRIDVRQAEVPGYNEAHNKMGTFMRNLESAFGVPDSRTEKPYNPSDKNPLNTMNTYLFNLRESIVTKTVAPK